MFHSLIPLKNFLLFKGIVKCETFFTIKMGNWPLFNVHCTTNIFSCWPSMAIAFAIQAWNNFTLFTKHVLSITHFPFMLFSYFSIKVKIPTIKIQVVLLECQLGLNRHPSHRSWRRPWRTRQVLSIVQYMCAIDVWL